jgi:hypothetical protein
MIKTLTAALLAIGLAGSPVYALPSMSQSGIPDDGQGPLVKVATSYQKKAGYRVCRAQYGSRLAYVTFSRNRYVCHFRKSTKVLTRQAASKCRKGGLRLAKINSIRIKGNQSITRYTCKR